MSSADGVEERSSREVCKIPQKSKHTHTHTLLTVCQLNYATVVSLEDLPDEGGERRRQRLSREGEEEEQEIPNAIILQDQRQEGQGQKELEAVASLDGHPIPPAPPSAPLPARPERLFDRGTSVTRRQKHANFCLFFIEHNLKLYAMYCR